MVKNRSTLFLMRDNEKQQIGEDSKGTPLYPGDIVVDMDDIERVIEFGTYREIFDCGYVKGYWIPDGCKKKIKN